MNLAWILLLAMWQSKPIKDYRVRIPSETIVGDDHGYCSYHDAGGGYCYEHRGNRAMVSGWGKNIIVINYVDRDSIAETGHLPSPQLALFMLDWEIRHR